MPGITWWSPARDDALRQLAAGRLTAAEIARDLFRRFGRHVTAEAVRHRAARLDPPARLLARGGRPPQIKQ